MAGPRRSQRAAKQRARQKLLAAAPAAAIARSFAAEGLNHSAASVSGKGSTAGRRRRQPQQPQQPRTAASHSKAGTRRSSTPTRSRSTTVDRSSNPIDTIANNGVANCPHIKSTKHPILPPKAAEAIVNPRNWMCAACGTTDGVWACLHCPSFACGRQQSKHALDHHLKTGHALVMDICSQYVHCYKCEEWVVADDSFEDLAHLREQLSTIQDQTAPPSVTRSGRVIRTAGSPNDDVLQSQTREAEKLDRLDTAMRRWRNSMLLSAFLAWRAFVQARKDSGPPSTGSESSEDAGEEDEEQGGEEEEQGNEEQGERKEERDDEQWGTTGAGGEVSVSPRPRKRGRGRPRKHRQRRRGRPSAAEAAEAESSKDATGSATSGGGDEVEATSNQDTASSTSETASPRKGRGRMKRRNSTLQAAVAELLSHPRRRNGTAAPTTTKHLAALRRMKMVAEPGMSGLRNLGQTCYMNAVLQVFSHIAVYRLSLYDLGKRGLLLLLDATHHQPQPNNRSNVSHLSQRQTSTAATTATQQQQGQSSSSSSARPPPLPPVTSSPSAVALSPSSPHSRAHSASPNTKRANFEQRMNALERQTTSECFTYLQTPLPGMTSYLRTRTRASRPTAPAPVENMRATHLLESLFRVLWSGKWAVVTPTAILGTVWRTAPSFRGYRQQDAQELLLLLEDAVERDLESIERRLQQVAPLPPSVHVLRSALHGQLQTSVQCAACGRVSTTAQPFASLALDLPVPCTGGSGGGDAASSRAHKRDTSSSVGRDEHDHDSSTNGSTNGSGDVLRLRTLLLRFFAPERLEHTYHCDACSPTPPCKRAKAEQQPDDSNISTHTGGGDGGKTEGADGQGASGDSGDGTMASVQSSHGWRRAGRRRPNHNAAREPAAPPSSSSPSSSSSSSSSSSPCASSPARPSSSAPTPVLRSAVKSCAISQLPSVLKVHVKRFCWQGTHRAKLQQHVALPLSLDMAPYCTPGCEVEADARFAETEYDLAAVITHEGRDLNSGHYKSYCNLGGSARHCDRWILANDARVRIVSVEEVLSAQAYVAFYVHRAVTEYVADALHVYPDTPLAPHG